MKRKITPADTAGLCLCPHPQPWRFRFCTLATPHYPSPHRFDGVIGAPTLTKRRILHVGLPAVIVGLAVGVLVGLAVLP